jgi:hypothetical protein
MAPKSAKGSNIQDLSEQESLFKTDPRIWIWVSENSELLQDKAANTTTAKFFSWELPHCDSPPKRWRPDMKRSPSEAMVSE